MSLTRAHSQKYNKMSAQHHEDDFVTPFGTVLGVYSGVEGLSNGSDHYFSRELNFEENVCTGYKYQCVEFARRWLFLSKGLDFHSVPFAAFIWKLKFIERVSDLRCTLITPIPNGSNTPPVPDSFLIWKIGEDIPVGHIAVITEVNTAEGYIRIAEQNVSNNYWPGNYARELKLDNINGEYWIRDEHEIFGWMVINFDVDGQDQDQLKINDAVKKHKLEKGVGDLSWLDLDNPAQKLYGEYWHEFLINLDSYYTMESHLSDKILFASMELNFIALMATDKVLKDDERLKKFGLPDWVIPFLKDSWGNMFEMIGKIICNRTEVAFNGKDVKLLNFDGDTVFGLLEAIIQDQWAKAHGCDIGISSSENIYTGLLDMCRGTVTGFVHILIDEDPKNHYIALFLQQVFKEIGHESKIIIGNNFLKNEEGKFTDSDGKIIERIWKSYHWEYLILDYEIPRQGNELKISDLFFTKEGYFWE